MAANEMSPQNKNEVVRLAAEILQAKAHAVRSSLKRMEESHEDYVTLLCLSDQIRRIEEAVALMEEYAGEWAEE